MESISSLIETGTAEQKDGKHLVFLLEENSYGIPIMAISEINGLMKITPLPQTPEYIRGVINLRGRIIPVLDLRLKFGMPKREYDEQTCIIIVNLKVDGINHQTGVIVDIVSEVFNIPLSEIEAPPEYGTQAEDGFLSGIGKIKGKLVMLLNMEKILHSSEIIRLIVDKKNCAEPTDNTEIEV